MLHKFLAMVFLVATSGMQFALADDALPRCLFVSSYHQGYAWSDGVQEGVESVLEGRCELRQFDMDTKRRKSEADKRAAALDAKGLIDSWKPDVVIAADDNASRYLIKPYFRGADLPFVFCGVNWSVDEYEYPYSNVTGMIEVAPLVPMLDKAVELSGSEKPFHYIGANTATERKNLARFEKAAKKLGLKIESRLVNSLSEWLDAYEAAQEGAFIAVGSYAGIADWDIEAASRAIATRSRVLSVTNHHWMMGVSMLGFTKIPSEHGAWAAEAALTILDGVKPTEIPIIANRKWDLWVNKDLLSQTGLQLPPALSAKAKRFN